MVSYALSPCDLSPPRPSAPKRLAAINSRSGSSKRPWAIVLSAGALGKLSGLDAARTSESIVKLLPIGSGNRLPFRVEGILRGQLAASHRACGGVARPRRLCARSRQVVEQRLARIRPARPARDGCMCGTSLRSPPPRSSTVAPVNASSPVEPSSYASQASTDRRGSLSRSGSSVIPSSLPMRSSVRSRPDAKFSALLIRRLGYRAQIGHRGLAVLRAPGRPFSRP